MNSGSIQAVLLVLGAALVVLGAALISAPGGLLALGVLMLLAVADLRSGDDGAPGSGGTT